VVVQEDMTCCSCTLLGYICSTFLVFCMNQCQSPACPTVVALAVGVPGALLMSGFLASYLWPLQSASLLEVGKSAAKVCCRGLERSLCREH
jgi:hypothetical protein